jgi:hypothetical protein
MDWFHGADSAPQVLVSVIAGASGRPRQNLGRLTGAGHLYSMIYIKLCK